jgi:hypothetical protein
MAKKIAKRVRKSGRTTGVVPFTPSSTPVADKLAEEECSILKNG